jgi:hypothetical protein
MNITKSWLLKVVKKTSGLYMYVELGTVLAYELFCIFHKVSVRKTSNFAYFPHFPGLNFFGFVWKQSINQTIRSDPFSSYIN